MSVFYNYLKFFENHPVEELAPVLRSYEQYQTQLFDRKTNKWRKYEQIINKFDGPHRADTKKLFH